MSRDRSFTDWAGVEINGRKITSSLKRRCFSSVYYLDRETVDKLGGYSTHTAGDQIVRQYQKGTEVIYPTQKSALDATGTVLASYKGPTFVYDFMRQLLIVSDIVHLPDDTDP